MTELIVGLVFAAAGLGVGLGIGQWLRTLLD